MSTDSLQFLERELERDWCNGRLLEYMFYEKTKERIKNATRILHEIDIRRQYGWLCASIDFLVEFENGIVLVQCKYRNSRRRENRGVANFLNSISVLTRQYEKPFLFGLWISRIPPYEDNIELLKNNSIEIVACPDTVEKLTEQAISCLKEKRFLQHKHNTSEN